jgi:hypothetical protein
MVLVVAVLSGVLSKVLVGGSVAGNAVEFLILAAIWSATYWWIGRRRTPKP